MIAAAAQTSAKSTAWSWKKLIGRGSPGSERYKVCAGISPARQVCIRFGGSGESRTGGLGIRQAEVREHLLDVPALVVLEQRLESREGVDRKARLFEILHVGGELAEGDRREHRARVDQQVGHLRLSQLVDELLG